MLDGAPADVHKHRATLLQGALPWLLHALSNGSGELKSTAAQCMNLCEFDDPETVCDLGDATAVYSFWQMLMELKATANLSVSQCEIESRCWFTGSADTRHNRAAKEAFLVVLTRVDVEIDGQNAFNPQITICRSNFRRRFQQQISRGVEPNATIDCSGVQMVFRIPASHKA